MTRSRGFTLIEMAIVLVIITILIGGLAMPLSAQIQARRVAETKKTLEEASDALMGFAMMTATDSLGTPQDFRYFPCPDTTGDGIQDRAGTGTGECLKSDGSAVGPVAYGWLPWVTLGAAPQDAWGNRLRYVVVSQFANSSSGFFRSTHIGNPIQICTTRTCPPPSVANNVVFALISHGPNGWGALNISGAQLAPNGGPDEKENLLQNPVLVMRTPTKADAVLGEFDDLVVWMAQPILNDRICPANATGSGCDH